jgi:hypothetical protein
MPSLSAALNAASFPSLILFHTRVMVTECSVVA